MNKGGQGRLHGPEEGGESWLSGAECGEGRSPGQE